jgi:uncharacterized protein (DUF952 family)
MYQYWEMNIQEELDIRLRYNTANPGAVMVHSLHAAFNFTAVVGSIRLPIVTSNYHQHSFEL